MRLHLTGAAVSMMTSVGYQTGLFEKMAALPPSTSLEIAAAAGLQERYVREWLSAMASAGVLTYDPADGTFALPASHVRTLTQMGGAENAGPMARLLASIGATEHRLISAFRDGGGVSYGQFRNLGTIIAETGDGVLCSRLDAIAEVSPSLRERLRAGIEVLDLGCGRGRAAMLLARRFPRSRFVGIDLSLSSIQAARQDAEEYGLQNVSFQVGDAAVLSDEGRFGLVLTFNSMHEQARPEVVLRAIYRSMKKGAMYLMIEPDGSSHLEENLDLPLSTVLYTISTFLSLPVSHAAGGEGLGMLWGRENAVAMLRATGFSEIRVEPLADDPINACFVATKL
jgi:ubiquinone/menaquinone biosynthesis C-methylase UbiE